MSSTQIPFCAGLFMMLFSSSLSANKRLVLHSDVDMAAAIQTLMSRLDAVTKHVADLESEVQVLKSGSVGGSIYTRWGRTTCPQNGTELVYEGFTAGNDLNSNGAADYICLSNAPIWGVFDDSAQRAAPRLYGTEYEFSAQFDDGGAHFFGQNLHNHDAPCAVCRSSRSTTVMIPGRNQCYPGWTMEYSGYLVSSISLYTSPSNYACLDTQSEWEFGDREDRDGKLMFVVEAACGSLKCPPYIQNREITCVVCSK